MDKNIAHVLVDVLKLGKHDVLITIKSLGFVDEQDTSDLEVDWGDVVIGSSLVVDHVRSFSGVLNTEIPEGSFVQIDLTPDVQFDLYGFDSVLTIVYLLLQLRDRWIVSYHGQVYTGLKDFKFSNNRIVSDSVTLQGFRSFSVEQNGSNIRIQLGTKGTVIESV